MDGISRENSACEILADTSDLDFYLQAQRAKVAAMTDNFNRRFWLWLLAGIGAVALAFPVDDAVDGALVVANPSSLHDVAWWCSKIGEGWAVGIGGILLAAFFVWRKKTVIAANIFFIALTSELAGLVATIFRVLIGRTRPTAPLPQGFYGVWHDGHWLIGKYQFSSFPSGHAASAVGLVVAAWLVHRGWGAATAVYALAVMWSRIALNCHHLSDVVASAVLAIPLALLLKKNLAPSVEFQFGNLHRAWKKK
jgi:membrane-associated phospholipid phosphatase